MRQKLSRIGAPSLRTSYITTKYALLQNMQSLQTLVISSFKVLTCKVRSKYRRSKRFSFVPFYENRTNKISILLNMSSMPGSTTLCNIVVLSKCKDALIGCCLYNLPLRYSASD